MLINKALANASLQLKNSCENSARVAKILLMYELGVSFEWLFLHSNDELKSEDKNAYFLLVNRFYGGEPLEYITGKASFYALEFEIARGVLIPRPESEILVDKSLEVLAKIDTPCVCEIGVGSGIISILLALKLPNARIVATDINETAIALAHKNARKFGVSERIKFINTNLMDGVKGEFDMIISNPPYIAADYELEKRVLAEPANALFGGEKGDEILKQIIALSSKRGVKNLACEMGYDQKDSMMRELENFNYEAHFYTDLAGLDRGFVAKKL